MHEFWVYDLNPVPWKAATGGRRTPYSSDGNMTAYKNALKEELSSLWKRQPLSGDLDLEIYFWRQLEEYTKKGRKVKNKRADSTNLLKVTEDAMQKIVFDNDSQNRSTRAEIVGQGSEVRPAILFRLSKFEPSQLLPVYPKDDQSTDWEPTTVEGLFD